MKKNNFTPHGIYFVCTCVCERTEVCVKGQKYVWAEYAIYIKSFLNWEIFNKIDPLFYDNDFPASFNTLLYPLQQFRFGLQNSKTIYPRTYI